jgi:hypothetical protein
MMSTEMSTEINHLVVSMYCESLLAFSKLTLHQQERLQQCRERPDANVHLRAPAGAGKTFVALELLIEALQKCACQDTEANVQTSSHVLYMASNEAMAVFMPKWIYTRLGSTEAEELLPWLHILYPTPPESPATQHVFPQDQVYKVYIQMDDIKTQFTRPSHEYILVVVDEGHIIYRDPQLSRGIAALTAPGTCTRLLVLSDISQSDGSTIHYPNVLDVTVDLEEVVRCSQRLVTAAKSFQLLSGKTNTTRCLHNSVGPPVCAVLFPAIPGKSIYKQYAVKIAQTIKVKILDEFPGLSLHDRLTILVPSDQDNNDFKSSLKPFLQRELAKLTVLGIKNCLKLIDAAASSRVLQSASVRSRHQKIVYDTMEAFDGLEKLMVIAVGMDTPRLDECVSRSQIYRAITRAHMLACIVNVHVFNGWLEFLGLVSFDERDLYTEEEELKNLDQNAANNFEKTLRNQNWLAKHLETDDKEGLCMYSDDDSGEESTSSEDIQPDNQVFAANEGNSAGFKPEVPKVLSTVWDTRLSARLTTNKNPRYNPLAPREQVCELLCFIMFRVAGPLLGWSVMRPGK